MTVTAAPKVVLLWDKGYIEGMNVFCKGGEQTVMLNAAHAVNWESYIQLSVD